MPRGKYVKMAEAIIGDRARVLGEKSYRRNVREVTGG